MCAARRRHDEPLDIVRRRGAPHHEISKGGESIVTFTDLVAYFRARFGVEEGQTMAEYGVVLAVITALVVGAILALSQGIKGALNTVTGYL
jgi:Flp pilus assembly pilin Flp